MAQAAPAIIAISTAQGARQLREIKMTAVTDFTPATVLPTNFRIDEVDKLQQLASAGAISTPTLGPLAAFTGTF